MTAPHPSQSGRPLLVVGDEVTGSNKRTGSSLFLVETTTKDRKGKTTTETTGIAGSLSKGLSSILIKPGKTIRIRNVALLGL